MYKKIMVPLDGSELAECVLPHVQAFITGFQVDTIVFVRVVQPFTPAVGGEYSINLDDLEKRESERISEAEDYLYQVVKQIKPNGTKLETKAIVGRVADKLVDCADENDISLILIATHGRSGISRWVRGSIADRILRAASVPVLMVRAPGSVTGAKD